jgi:hypothetical protein
MDTAPLAARSIPQVRRVEVVGGRVGRWMSERHGRAAQAKPAAVGRGVDGHTPRQRTWWLEGKLFGAEILHVQDLLALGLCFESNFPLPVNTCRENGLRPRASQAWNVNARAGSTRASPGAGGQLRGSTPLFRGRINGGGCQLRMHSVRAAHMVRLTY